MIGLKSKAKIKNVKIITIFLVMLFLFLPIFSQAAGLVPCGGPGESQCSFCYFLIMLKNIMAFGSGLFISLSIIMIVISGITSIVSFGGVNFLTRAKSALKACIKGMIIVLLAWLIINSILLALSAKTDLGIGRPNWYTFDCNAGLSGGASESAGESQNVLIVDPNMIVFSEAIQEKQLKVTFNGKDVTGEASYSIQDSKLAEVSKSGLVKVKTEALDGSLGKETKLNVSYGGKTDFVDIVFSSNFCPMETAIKGSEKRVSAQYFFLKAFAESNRDNIGIAITPKVITPENVRKGFCLEICLTGRTSPFIPITDIALTPHDDLSPMKKLSASNISYDKDNDKLYACFDYHNWNEIVEGYYDILIREKGNQLFQTFSNKLEIRGLNAKCTSLKPQGLSNFDNRIPVVFEVADNFELNALDTIKQLANQFIDADVTPVDTNFYTFWFSEEIGKNACPQDNRTVYVFLSKTDSSKGEGITENFCNRGIGGGLTERNSNYIFLCLNRLYKNEFHLIISHEMGHAQGGLQDEYSAASPLGIVKGNGNCFEEKSEKAKGVAGIFRDKTPCEYYKEILSDYDCNFIREGCNTRFFGWFRSADNSIMRNDVTGTEFGDINKKLYLDKMPSLGFRSK